MAGEQALVLYGSIAVQEKLLTREQLDEGIRIQENSPGNPPLGEILLDLNYLTPAQHAKILDLQRQALQASAGSPSSGDTRVRRRLDNLFGKLAVSLGFCTPAKINEAIRLQTKDREAGIKTPLGRILCDKQYLDEAQILAILHIQEHSVVGCPPCGKWYRAEAGKVPTTCKHCGSALRPATEMGSLDPRELLAGAAETMAGPVAAPPDITQYVDETKRSLPAVRFPTQQEPAHLGRLAVSLGLITQMQLDECLALQRRSQPPKPLGRVLQERRYLNQQQVTKLLVEQERRLAGAGGLPAHVVRNTQLGELACKQGFLGREDLNRLLREQAQNAEAGYKQPIGRVLIDKGVLTQKNLDHLSRRQRRMRRIAKTRRQVQTSYATFVSLAAASVIVIVTFIMILKSSHTPSSQGVRQASMASAVTGGEGSSSARQGEITVAGSDADPAGSPTAKPRRNCCPQVSPHDHPAREAGSFIRKIPAQPRSDEAIASINPGQSRRPSAGGQLGTQPSPDRGPLLNILKDSGQSAASRSAALQKLFARGISEKEVDAAVEILRGPNTPPGLRAKVVEALASLKTSQTEGVLAELALSNDPLAAAGAKRLSERETKSHRHILVDAASNPNNPSIIRERAMTALAGTRDYGSGEIWSVWQRGLADKKNPAVRVAAAKGAGNSGLSLNGYTAAERILRDPREDEAVKAALLDGPVTLYLHIPKTQKLVVEVLGDPRQPEAVRLHAAGLLEGYRPSAQGRKDLYAMLGKEGEGAVKKALAKILAPYGKEKLYLETSPANAFLRAKTVQLPPVPRTTKNAEADYPGASRFVQAKKVHKGREGFKPLYIVIHTTEGSKGGTISWFQNPQSGVSSHYVVGLDGEVVQMTKESDAATHIGGRWYDYQSFGIEHEGFAHKNTWTPEQVAASVQLVQYLCKKFRIPADRAHIVGHYEIQSSTRTDPGPYFDWSRYMSMVAGKTPKPAIHDPRQVVMDYHRKTLKGEPETFFKIYGKKL